LAWTIEYAESARKQLRKLDKPTAKRIVDFMDERVSSGDPRRLGKVLKGPLGDLWEIQDGVLTVLVLQIGKRREIYR
jgi:mRNA interferase RelE/StbE